MSRRNRTLHGFTLMELMITVAILGILAAIAIPTFSLLMKRAKTAEASSNLNSMFKCASSYYSQERSGKGQNSSVSGYCIMPSINPVPPTPTRDKQVFNDSAAPEFKALGFHVADQVYFSYGAISGTPNASTCGHGPGDNNLYTFYAHGDLDQDGIQSTFEMAAGSDSQNNTMYHSFGIYVDKEME